MAMDDLISRESIKKKLQEQHDFFVNAYGGFNNLPKNDKSRVDEITNCIAMVVNEPSVQPDQKEITMEDVKAYCEPRNLVVLTKELFDQMNNTADKIYLYLQDRERR